MRFIALTLDLGDELVHLLSKLLALVSCQIHDKLLDSLARSTRLDLN